MAGIFRIGKQKKNILGEKIDHEDYKIDQETESLPTDILSVEENTHPRTEGKLIAYTNPSIREREGLYGYAAPLPFNLSYIVVTNRAVSFNVQPAIRKSIEKFLQGAERLRICDMGDSESFVFFGEGESYLYDCNDRLSGVLSRLNEENERVRSVVLGENSSYVVLTEEHCFAVGSTSLLEALQRSGTPRLVALGPNESYVIIDSENRYIAQGIPEGLTKALNDINEQNGKITIIALGPNKSFCILWETLSHTGFASERIPSSMREAIREFIDSGHKIRCVSIHH